MFKFLTTNSVLFTIYLLILRPNKFVNFFIIISNFHVFNFYEFLFFLFISHHYIVGYIVVFNLFV